MEIHLFILWSKVSSERENILSDIAGKFIILDIYKINWEAVEWQ